jgi:bifunctional non-homologous end joining protein LigD
MAERLQRYREMRDFLVTPEPSGRRSRRKATRSARQLRYYIQRHAATRLHYDFRLELDGVLKSWAVPKGPSFNPADKRLAVQTEDHPLEYGEFEGVIPEKQYGAGEVLLWDRGAWTSEDADPRQALRAGRLHFRLDGEKLRGSWILTRTRGAEDKPQWLLIKRNDEEADPDLDITRERQESVKKAPGRARRATTADLPQFIAPMLATLVAEPPQRGKWVYEVKHDGYRMLARLGADGAVRLFTRSGNDWTGKLPQLAAALGQLRLKNTWLDGEIVVLGPDGRASFQALQNAFDAGRDAGIVYFVFDAPFLAGRDLRRLPLAERKKRLRKALADSSRVRFSEDLNGSAAEVLEHACKLGLEGLIGKETDSVYVSGRAKSWIKLKCRRRQDFVIGGYTPPRGSRSGFGALLVGLYDERGRLHFTGKVGTGFDEQRLAGLMRRFAALKRRDPPFADPPREKGVQWLRPALVAEVAYTERTEEGILRQASFMGLREDLPAKNVHEEKAVPPPAPRKPSDSSGNTVLGVKITHPDRLVWPELGVKKVDLARYVEEVGDWFLPHLKDRPLSLVRCPDGVAGECFYQRHLTMAASPGSLRTVKRERSRKSAYIYAESLDAVVSAVQNGAVEFHTWGATVPDIRHPDRFTMDLDPDEALPWKALVEATLLTRTLIEGLGLKCFLKTTGGKGLHVVAPIQPALEWGEVKAFTQRIAETLVKARPDLFTAKIAKARRPNKVFADYLRNSETASAVAAFSPRARPNAGVSVPLAWEELDPKEDVRSRFNVRNVPARLASLKKDPWAGYWTTRQAITPKMKKSLGL